MDDLIYESRRSKITFCFDKRIAMMTIDMSKLPWWKRAFAKKEFVMWDDDIKKLKEFILAYENSKGTTQLSLI